jgi:hypothetical protein
MSSLAENDDNSDNEMDAVDSLTFADDDDDNAAADAPTEKGLIGALRSLERSVNAHCQLLGRRLTREPTNKSAQPPLTEAAGIGRPSVSGPVMPKTTAAVRGDKVSEC